VLESSQTSLWKVAAVTLGVGAFSASIALQLVGAEFGATVASIIETEVLCSVLQQVVIVRVDLPVVPFAMGPGHFTEELVQRQIVADRILHTTHIALFFQTVY